MYDRAYRSRESLPPRLVSLCFHQESEALMRACVKWGGTLSPELMKLVEDKAQGNPLMIKEVMITLAGKGKLVSAEAPVDAVSSAGEAVSRGSASGAPKCVISSCVAESRRCVVGLEFDGGSCGQDHKKAAAAGG
jgi:hypothetical protein